MGEDHLIFQIEQGLAVSGLHDARLEAYRNVNQRLQPVCQARKVELEEHRLNWYQELPQNSKHIH